MDGRIYVGEFKDNLMHHFGEFLWRNGNRYLGHYKNDRKDGIGLFYKKQNDVTFVGIWKAGELNGPGILYKKGKTKYTIWKHGLRERKLRDVLVFKKIIHDEFQQYKSFFNVNPKIIISDLMKKVLID